MTITFVRHTSVGVGPGVCYGHSDVPVAETFAAEAKAVVDALGGRRFDAVHTSPSTRCVRLAEACGHPDAMRDPRLMEMDFGRWEMQRWDDIRDPRLQLWYDDWINTPATGASRFSTTGGASTRSWPMSPPRAQGRCWCSPTGAPSCTQGSGIVPRRSRKSSVCARHTAE